MALEFQEVDIDMTGQLDTKSDPKNVVQTNLDTAENVVYTEFGSLAPRQSSTTRGVNQRDQILSYESGLAKTDITLCGASPALNPGVTNFNTLYKCADQVLSSDGYRMMSYNRVTNEHQIVGSYVPCVSSLVDINSFTCPINPIAAANDYVEPTVLSPETVVVGNYRISAFGYGYDGAKYAPENTVYMSVEDIQANTVVINKAVVYTGPLVERLKIVVTTDGVAVMAILNNGAFAATAVAAWWTTASPTTYVQFTGSFVTSYSRLKAISYNPSSDRFMTIENDGADLKAIYYTTSGGTTLTVLSVVTISAGVNALAAGASPNTAGANVYDVVWCTSATASSGILYSARVNQALTIAPVTHAAVPISSIAANGLYAPFIKQESTTGFVIVGANALQVGYDSPRMFYFTLSDVTLVKNTSKTQFYNGYRFFSQGEPIVYDRQVYLAGAVSDIGGSRVALLRLSSVVAYPEIAYAGLIRGTSTYIGQPTQSSSLSELYIPNAVVTSSGPSVLSGAAPSEIRFTYSKISFAQAGVVGAYVEYNGGTVIGGAYPKFYDRASLTEFGFLSSPVIPSAVLTTAIAPKPDNLLSGNTYSYRAVYVWTDANGRKHRSQPSLVKTLSTGMSNGAGDLDIEKPAITAKYRVDDSGLVRDIYTEVYRTLANQSGPFYLVATVPCDGDPTTDTTTTIAVRDDVTDAELSSAQQIYTTGDVLANETPPPISSLCVYSNRLFGVNSETNRVFYLKSSTTQDFGGYSSLLEITVGNPAEKLTAIGALDQSVFAFTETKTFQANGLPANDQGVGSTIDSFLPIASEVGCPYTKSILSFGGGMFMYTLKGFYLLDRGGNSQYIGAPVEEYTPGYVCTGASLVYGEGTWQARFMMATPDRSASFILCYDTQLGKWSRHTYSSSTVGGDLVWADGFLWISGVVPGLASSFLREDPPRTNTASENFVCRVRTGWIAPFGRMHQGKIRRVSALLAYPVNGSDVVTMTVETNYGNPGSTNNTTTSQQYVLEYGTGLYTLGVPSVSRLRLRTKSQRAESFRITLSWTKQSPYPGAWTSVTAFSAEVAGMQGAGRLPLSQTMTNT